MPIILTKGRLPEEEWYSCTCQHCRTYMKFQKKEAKASINQRDGTTYSLKCPFCSRTIYLSSLTRYYENTVDPY